MFEVIAMLLALDLIAGRRTIWLPDRRSAWTWPVSLGDASQARSSGSSDGFSAFRCPRLQPLMRHRLTADHLPLAVSFFSRCPLAAFLAPPFSGLDTLPALGVVVLAVRGAARGFDPRGDRLRDRRIGHADHGRAGKPCYSLAAAAGLGRRHSIARPLRRRGKVRNRVRYLPADSVSKPPA